MLDAVVNVSQVTNLLALLGSAGTAIGGSIGWILGASTWRQAFEDLARGAAAGGVFGCVLAFFLYSVVRIFGC